MSKELGKRCVVIWTRVVIPGPAQLIKNALECKHVADNRSIRWLGIYPDGPVLCAYV